VAAVAGRLFRLPALRAVLDDVVPSAVDAALDDLMARDIVVRAEGDTYTYRHMLFREVAYGMLSRSARIRLHAAMADWLRTSGADRPDEFAELVAYHFQRASQIARDSAVPLDLPFDPAHAVAWLVRAGRLASHSGALSQAIAYLRSAIALAPRDDHPELYELLGDYATLGEAALDGYRRALEQVRKVRVDPPATGAERVASAQVGARLLRKLVALYLCTPGTLIEHPSGEAVRALLDEGLFLAEEAGDQDERWRLRVVALWWPEYRGDFTLEEAEEGCRTALAAAAHFEARQDWTDFSRALDGYAMHCMRRGTYADALDATQRRLDVPTLPPAERSDALTMISFLNYEAGNFAACVENMRATLRGIRPGEEMVHLHPGALYPVWAAYESGCWSALGELMAPLEALWEQAQQQASAGQRVAFGYTIALLVALAREDRDAIEMATAVIEQTIPQRLVNMRALVRALRADDPRLLELDRASGVTGLRLVVDLCNEHGVLAPAWVIDDIHAREGDVSVPHGSKVAISAALATGDDTRLAAAIEDAEVRGLVVHAARMRVVLARRTGDRAQLDRAAPVLQRLDDRRGLRRLEAVAARLGEERE
jgi:tetratricopeptide (TPR) repeat protein